MKLLVLMTLFELMASAKEPSAKPEPVAAAVGRIILLADDYRMRGKDPEPLAVLKKVQMDYKDRGLYVHADYESSGLIDKIGDYMDSSDIPLPEAIWARLRKWVKAYDFVVPLDMSARDKHSEKIRALDVEGRTLAAEISQLLNCKVRYLSEGTLKWDEE